MTKDREVWLKKVMEEMDVNLKCNKQGDFFRKLRDLNISKVKPMPTILDESGQPYQDQ